MLDAWLLQFQKIFELDPEEDSIDTYKEILEGTRFRGHNAWVLCFAMILACIGLNTDATSAVIGAMLISPLMGPILGFAFGLAIEDRRLKRIGIMHWLYMTLISLFSSTLFFVISPFEFDTTQLLSFRQATIFDILLAFFGGMAGYIGIVKRDGYKVLSGVAVATACMPPLCTAGYGIAHLDWAYAVGGLYFYGVNCLFIGFATFLLARFTKIHLQINPQCETTRTHRKLWIALIVVMTLPACFLAYKKWEIQKNTLRTKSDKERIASLEAKIEQLEAKYRLCAGEK
jgi:uncharacterized hydrophobic protein (TIGR00271 family)